MSINRRDFLRTSAAAAVVAGGRAAAGAPLTSALVAPITVAPRAESYIEDLALEALNAAKDAGASYADARIGRSPFERHRESSVIASVPTRRLHRY